MGFYIPKPSYLPTPIPTLFTMFWPLPSSSPLSPFKNPPPSTSIITLTHSSLPIHKILTYIPLSSFPSLSQCSTALSHHVREYLTLYAHHNFRPYDLSVSLSDPINTFIPVHKKGSPTPTVVDWVQCIACSTWHEVFGGFKGASKERFKCGQNGVGVDCGVTPAGV